MNTFPSHKATGNGFFTCAVAEHHFTVHDSQKVWIVNRGKIDLFLQTVDDDQRPSARFHVARVGEGQALLGIDVSEKPFVVLVACPHPGTEFTSCWLNDIVKARQSQNSHGTGAMLEQWITSLSLAAAGEMVPRTFEVVAPGTILNTSEERVIVPGEPLVWIKQLQGSSQFLGLDLVVRPGDYFPLSRQGRAWLRVTEKSRLAVLDSNLMQLENPGWQWLRTFHSIILTCLLINREQRETVKREGIVKQKQSDAALVHRTLLGLASPLNAQVAEQVAGTEGTNDPLLLCCLRIGDLTGIDFKSPPPGNYGPDQNQAVEAVARASGIRHRVVLLRGNWWKQDNGALLGFLRKTNHPVVLVPRRRGYEIYDPGAGGSVRVDDEAASCLQPFAYSFYRPFPAKKLTGRDLLLFALRSARTDLLMIALMGVAGGLTMTTVPIVTGIIFDSVIPGAEHRQLFQLTLLLLVAAVATAMFGLVRSFSAIRLEGRIDAVVQPAIWDRLLRLPVPFFRNYTAGDLAVRSLAVSQIRQILTNSALTSILSGIFSIFSFCLLFYFSWKLALLATAIIALAVCFSAGCAYVQLSFVRHMTQVRGKTAAILLQFINGIAKFRVSGAEKRAFAAWSRTFAQQKQLYWNSRRASNSLAVFQSVLPVLALAGIFWATAGMIGPSGNSLMSTGGFLAFLAAFLQLLSSTMQFSSSVTSILSVVPLYERALPILHTLPEVNDHQASPGDLKGGLEVTHVNFRYTPEGPMVLHDVSFNVEPGEFVAFTGPSGSGKSTLLRLLLGFEMSESGTISYDGQDIVGIDIQAVRQQIGVVLQNGRLTSGSILDNIIGSARLTLDDAWEAARLAGLEQDIKAMPMGMHTVISEGGGGISGGQRQRLMIARAIVRRPRILFFDEASSALDNRTQALVSEGLRGLQATRIVIAHRLSTIKDADRILVFDHGKVVQSGNYEELLQQSGLFRDLVHRQMA